MTLPRLAHPRGLAARAAALLRLPPPVPSPTLLPYPPTPQPVHLLLRRDDRPGSALERRDSRCVRLATCEDAWFEVYGVGSSVHARCADGCAERERR